MDLDILKKIEAQQKIILTKIDFKYPDDTIYEKNNFMDRRFSITIDYNKIIESVRSPIAVRSPSGKFIINSFDKNQIVGLSIDGLPLIHKSFTDIMMLKNLNILILNDCDITKIPINLFDLPYLKFFSLRNNKIKYFSKFIINRPFVITVDNAIPEFKGEFLSDYNSEDEPAPEDKEYFSYFKRMRFTSTIDLPYVLDIFNNPIESPPIEIIKKGKSSIAEYFSSLGKGYKYVNEVKAILIGDGESGKTSLVKRIIENDFNKNEHQTHGISIRNWKFLKNNNEIIVHFWDFGGQEIMHATHQFFLSKRSLYILVLDGRRDEKTEYWLKHIESFGGDSPILIVLNKIDQNSSFEVNRKFLKEKYKAIKGFYRISCSENIGIDNFIKKLKIELSKVEILKTTWSVDWLNVKEQLEKISQPYFSYRSYRDLCLKNNINKKESQNTLVEFLHDLGLVIHFEEFELKDTYILEPQWITQAVYGILNSQDLSRKKGVISLNAIDKILCRSENNISKEATLDYPENKLPYIINLMEKFELCYKIDNNKILIPDLLEIQEPKFNFDYENALNFIVSYDFLPKSILPRLMVRLHKDIQYNLRWRTGFILIEDDSNCTSLIKSDDRENKILISVNGDRKRDYFSIIRKTLKDINESFEKLQTKELIPLPDKDDMFIEYDELVGYEIMGIEEYTVGKIRKSYNVFKLLNGIEKAMDRIVKYNREMTGKAITYNANRIIIDQSRREDNLSKNIYIGDGATFHGNFMVGNKIKESFNKSDSANVNDNLKDLLKQLTMDVAKMTEKLTDEQAEQIADDLQTLTNEAIREKPRQKWWELSAEGLKDAAKTVGDVGISVLKTLEKITPIITNLL